jgi:uncharacterized protein with FMN-binding domain
MAQNPDRYFNNGPISITLATETPDAVIYYTLDGSIPAAKNGTLYAGPFDLTFDKTKNTDYRGFVRVQAIALKADYPTSAMASRIFQVFPAEQIKGADGKPATGGPVTGTGTGYYAPVEVSLSLNDGYITNLRFINVDDKQTEAFFNMARTYAIEFFKVMNSADFVSAVSGASYSGNGVREAAQDAINKIVSK